MDTIVPTALDTQTAGYYQTAWVTTWLATLIVTWVVARRTTPRSKQTKSNTSSIQPYQTNYSKVIEFNKVFGVPVSDTPQKDIFTKDPKLVKLRMDLIREEVKELEEAVAAHDMTETLDALADILYVVYGMGCSLGLDLDWGMGLVHESNMSKSCKSEKEAKLTVEHYLFEDKRYDSPAYRRSDDGRYWVVYNKSSGKILKSINYKPVSFTQILG